MDRRALIVTYYYPPLGGGGVQRIGKLVKYLSRNGWIFTVITAQEESASLPQDVTLLEDIPKSTRVIRLPGCELPAGTGRAARISSYWKRWLSAFFYIPDMRKSWVPHARMAVEAELKSVSYDCILISIPPYSMAGLAADLRKTTGLPVILDMRDPWTLNPYKIHPTPLHRFIDRRMEFSLISRIRYGTSAYCTLIEYYSKRLGKFNPEYWHFSPNGYDEDDFRDIRPVQHASGYFHIGFSGTFYSHINNPEPLFRVVARLYRLNRVLAEKIRFHHIGKSMISLKKLAVKYGIEQNVKVWGYKTHENCLNILAGMNAVCFILDDRKKRSRYTIGGKVYEYLRLKKPVLAMVPEHGEAARLIEETHSGICIPGSDTKGLAETLLAWMENPPEFGYTGIEKYSRETLATAFGDYLEHILGTHPSRQ